MSANKRGLGKGLNELLAATLGASIVETDTDDEVVVSEPEKSEVVISETATSTSMPQQAMA